MFGEKIDTAILRLISHDRNMMTEKQIELEARKQMATYTPSDERFVKFVARSRGHFDWKAKRILDVGCERGDLANFLAKKGHLKSGELIFRSKPSFWRNPLQKG